MSRRALASALVDAAVLRRNFSRISSLAKMLSSSAERRFDITTMISYFGQASATASAIISPLFFYATLAAACLYIYHLLLGAAVIVKRKPPLALRAESRNAMLRVSIYRECALPTIICKW